MKLMVTGGRDFTDRAAVWNALDDIYNQHRKGFLLIHGDAIGVDSIADQWAREVGVLVARFPVYGRTWDRLGKKAGPLRNALMVGIQPDLVLAFPGGNGTASAVSAARAKGIPVREPVLEARS